jgi:hypothetical protein
MRCGIGIFSVRVKNTIKYLNALSAEHDEPITVVVNNITLEDYITFHDIDFEILEGFYYLGKGNCKFGIELAQLYQERRRYEAEGNKAVGKVIKLMLNASYGSCKPKPTASKFTYTQKLTGADGEEKMMAQRIRKWPLLLSYTEIGNNVETEWLHMDQDATLEVWAGLILAVSKRLMNHVFYACGTLTLSSPQEMLPSPLHVEEEEEEVKEEEVKEEETCAPVIYTDTDSLVYPYHLRRRMAQAFDRLYESTVGRPLIGKELAQFHSDFDLTDPTTGESCDPDKVRSIFTIVVGRKLYLHVITTGEGFFGYKLSCKGFPKSAVLHYAQQFYQKTRKRLLYDNELTPDVTDTTLRGLAMMFTALARCKKLIINLYPKALKRSNFKFTGRGQVITSQDAMYRTMVMTGDVDPLITEGERSREGLLQDPDYLAVDYAVESDSELEDDLEARRRADDACAEVQLQRLKEFGDLLAEDYSEADFEELEAERELISEGNHSNVPKPTFGIGRPASEAYSFAPLSLW